MLNYYAGSFIISQLLHTLVFKITFLKKAKCSSFLGIFYLFCGFKNNYCFTQFSELCVLKMNVNRN